MAGTNGEEEYEEAFDSQLITEAGGVLGFWKGLDTFPLLFQSCCWPVCWKKGHGLELPKVTQSNSVCSMELFLSVAKQPNKQR